MCVAAATIVPHFWLCAIGIGGVGVGYNYCRLSRIPDLPKISKEFLVSIGLRSLCNVGLVTVGGFALAYYVTTSPVTYGAYINYQAVTYFLSILMTYYMLSSFSRHMTKAGVSKLIGLIDRKSISSGGKN